MNRLPAANVLSVVGKLILNEDRDRSFGTDIPTGAIADRIRRGVDPTLGRAEDLARADVDVTTETIVDLTFLACREVEGGTEAMNE